MNRIKVLSHEEAQKIAAGEVVERPANIVKELVENALDAGAHHVSVYIEQAGKSLIRIVDDGCGMSAGDARLCFLPHATSKIKSIDDLATIQSFGFRGEALASIAAVSKVTLLTRPQEPHLSSEELGTYLEYQDGRCVQEMQKACAAGTDLAVHDLFYNVPVRKKFLKQDETEWNQIVTLIQAFCLSHLSIHFKLHHNNKLFLHAPATATLSDRMNQLFGYQAGQSMLSLGTDVQNIQQPVFDARSWFSITGLTSHQHFWRYGRQHIFFFVNQRWVKDQELSKALLKGYLNVLPPGKYPAAAVFISVKQDHVDVNVHPKKEEVRFLKPVALQTALQELVKQALERRVATYLSSSTITPATAQKVERQSFEKVVERNQFLYQPKFSFEQPVSVKKEFPHDIFDEPPVLPLPEKSQEATHHVSASAHAFELPVSIVPETTTVQDKPIEENAYSYRFVGQFFNTYLIIEHDETVVIIDQHAAHERILYERLVNNFNKLEGTILLFPELIKLSEHRLTLLMQERDFFASLGIVFEQFGKQELAITSCPPLLQKQSLQDLMQQAANFIEEYQMLEKEQFRKKMCDHVHGQMACKMAIKSGDQLNQEQIKQLITDLQSVPNGFICVHGRPTMWTITQQELEKQFKRR